jgi:hypothetical protein
MSDPEQAQSCAERERLDDELVREIGFARLCIRQAAALSWAITGMREALGRIAACPGDNQLTTAMQWAKEALDFHAIAITTAADILRKRDSETLRRAARILDEGGRELTADDWLDELEHMAAELEKS